MVGVNIEGGPDHFLREAAYAGAVVEMAGEGLLLLPFEMFL